MDQQVIQNLLWGKFSVQRLIGSVLFIYASLCAYAFFFSNGLIFHPGRPSSYQDTEEILKLESADGTKISAVYLPTPKATYTILYSHGNGEDMGEMMFAFATLQDNGFSVFAYDYRGYGTSEGQPSEQRTYQDIDAAYRYLTNKLGIPPERIVALGRSVGGGPAVDLAARKPLAGLIIESSFTTAFRVMTRIPLVPFDKFTNLHKLKRVTCPVLVIHGKQDRVVPFSHARQLFAAAREPKQFFQVDEAGHNDLLLIAGDEYSRTLQQFVQLIQKSQAASV